MDKFSALFYEYTEGACDYLRIKNVELISSSMTANVHIFVREDMYDNFDNKVIKQLQQFFRSIVKQYKVNFTFERLIVSESVVREELMQFLLGNFPFVTSNIRLDSIELELDEDIHVTLFLPTRVMKYALDNDFVNKVSEYLTDRFMCKAHINMELTDEIIEESESATSPTIARRIRCTDVKYLVGTRSPEPSTATLLEFVKEAQDNILVLGTVRNVQEKHYETQRAEDVKNKRTFYPYRYIITLDDTTDTIKVIYKAKESLAVLKTPPPVLVVRGRVFYSEDRGEYAVFAKTIYSCNVDFQALKESRKPLPVPAQYRYQPLPVTVKERMTQMSLDEEIAPAKTLVGNIVFAWAMSTSTDGLVPYEISFLKVKDGVPTDHYTSYVFCRDVLAVDTRFKAYVSSAPRLGELTPDIVKFLDKSLVVAFDATTLQTLLTDAAKALHYKLDAEFWDASQLNKKIKDKESFLKQLAPYNIVPEDDTAYEYAYSLYLLYLEIKG